MNADVEQKLRMDEPIHTIANMVIEFDVATDESALATPEAILSQSRKHLLPALEQVLTDRALEAAVAQIDVLEIDLGEWPGDPVWSDLRRAFSEKFLAALQPYLTRPYLTRPQIPAVPQADVVQNADLNETAVQGPTDLDHPASKLKNHDPRGAATTHHASLLAVLSYLRRAMQKEKDPARRDAVARGVRTLAKAQSVERSTGVSFDQDIKRAMRALDPEAQAAIGSLLTSVLVPLAPNINGSFPTGTKPLRDKGVVVTGDEPKSSDAVDQGFARASNAAPSISDQLEIVTNRAVMIEAPLTQIIEQSGTARPLAAERARLIAPHIAIRTMMTGEGQSTPLQPSVEKGADMALVDTLHTLRNGSVRAGSDTKTKVVSGMGEPLRENLHLWISLLQAAGHSRRDVLATLAAVHGLEQGGLGPIASSVTERAGGQSGFVAQADAGATPFPDGQTSEAVKDIDGKQDSADNHVSADVLTSRDPNPQSDPKGRADKNPRSGDPATGPNRPLKDAFSGGAANRATDALLSSAGLSSAEVAAGQKNPTGEDTYSVGTPDQFNTGHKQGAAQQPEKPTGRDVAVNHETSAHLVRPAVTSTILAVADSLDADSGTYWRLLFDLIWRALPASRYDMRELATPQDGPDHSEQDPPAHASTETDHARPSSMWHKTTSETVPTPVARSSSGDRAAPLHQQGPSGSPTQSGRDLQSQVTKPLGGKESSSDPDGLPAHSERSSGAFPDPLSSKDAAIGDATKEEDFLLSSTGRTGNQNIPAKPQVAEDDLSKDYLQAVMALVAARRGPDDLFEDWLEDRLNGLIPEAGARRLALRRVAARLSYGDGTSSPVLKRLALAAVEKVLSRSMRKPAAPVDHENTTVQATDRDLSSNVSDQVYLSERGGLVLFHPYLPMLFDRLQLLDVKRQIPKEKIPSAYRALQLISDSAPPENQAPDPVETLLLGLSQNWVPASTTILPSADLAVINSLLVSVIEQWGALGQTSPDGLRDAFVRRNAALRKQEMSWLLSVDSGPFDMLLDRLPWSFGTIALPWMSEPCVVHWRDSDA